MVQNKITKLRGEITINKLLIACIVLLFLFIMISLIHSIKSAEIEDTLFVREAKTTYICFEYPECYLVDYNKFHEWVKTHDLTPKSYVPPIVPYKPEK
jgi:hypothetical protein